jgi:hypothetical protein
MAWLYPSFLWALFVLAIPIIIHLFNFRRYKKVVFPNVRLLQQLNHQTKSGNKLKKYLILLSRLLALLFLVFAFAQPVLLKKNQVLNGSKKYISIILDNSYSMNLDGSEGPLLEAAKNRARAIINASGNGDEFNIVSADMDPALMHFTGKQNTIDNIDKLKISSNTFPLNTLLQAQNNSLMKENGDKFAYTISDFQKSNSVLNKNPIDSAINQTWIKIDSDARDNLSIDSCYLESPIVQISQPITLAVDLSNYTSNDIEGSTLELWVDGKPKGMANFNVKSYQSTTQKIVFSVENGGKHRCELRLPGDNIPLDDVLYFSLPINDNYRVVNISADDEKYIDAIFSDNPGYTYKKENSGNISFSDFKNRDLIVLQGIPEIGSGLVSELLKFVKNGGSVLVFPAKEASFGGLLSVSNAFGFQISENPINTQLKVSSIDLEHPIFQSIFQNVPKKADLPTVSQYYNLQFTSGISLMKLPNNHVFLHDLPYGKGRLFISAVALDQSFSNFQNHALFVPFALRSAMLSKYKSPLYFSCSDAGNIYTTLPYENESGIQLKGEKTAFIPEVINKDGELVLNTNGEISEPGHYSLINKKADTTSADLSFNVNRIESDTRLMADSTYNSICENYSITNYTGNAEKLAAELNKMQKGVPLWKWCIIFSLICLLIEILLIRFFKNNVQYTT